ncbi:MAG: AbrB family transcriptional regulator [Synergistales bacterium]|nr:AbrB family transcriptional regulator [Synergistales bacterium]
MDVTIVPGMVYLFILGIIGWKLFVFLRFPAPDMLGALFMGSIIGMFGLQLAFPTNEITFVSKLVIGSFIGLKVNRPILREMRKIFLPAILVSFWMLILSISSGFLLAWVTRLSLGTALLGSSTGGLTEMALLGISLGEDQVSITFLQLFRVVFFLVFMPFIASCVNTRHAPKEGHSLPEEDIPDLHEAEISYNNYIGGIRLALTAIAGGLTGRILGIPAGDLLGSMFGVGICNVLWGGFSRVQPNLRVLARIGVGLAISREVTRETIMMLSSMLLPVSVLAIVMILAGILLSLILYRITNWNYSTCLLASSPAGLTQMSMIAEEVGADPLVVSVLHTVRLVSVFTVLPILFRFLID